MFKKIPLLIITLLLITACGKSPEPYKFTDEQRARAYTVRGETYYPLVNADGFVEEGHASWYGPGFHGNLTANGEIYNQNAMTAAHKFLPLGVYVYVQHTINKNIIRVKVNDRGPFIDDRIIDLSKEAADELGMLESGVANVVVATDKSDLDAAPTFIASRDNNKNSKRFKSSSSRVTPTKRESTSISSSVAATATAGASTSAAFTSTTSGTAASNPNMKTWSFTPSGKTYFDLRKEKYPESLTSIYEDDSSHPNPSYASTLGAEHRTYTNDSQSPARSTTTSNNTVNNSSSVENSTSLSSSSNSTNTLSSSSSSTSSASSVSGQAQLMPVKGKGTIYVQLATYNSKEEAEEKAKVVHSLGLPTTIKSASKHILLSGPYETRKKASNSRAVLQFRFPRAKVL